MGAARTKDTTGSYRNRLLGHIHILARELGLLAENRELLRAIVFRETGTEHLSDHGVDPRGIASLKRVRDALQLELDKAKRRRSRRKGDNVSQLPGPGQRETVDAILADIAGLIDLRDPEAYLESICNRTWGRPFVRMQRNQLQGLIEALKSIRTRLQKQRGGDL